MYVCVCVRLCNSFFLRRLGIFQNKERNFIDKRRQKKDAVLSAITNNEPIDLHNIHIHYL